MHFSWIFFSFSWESRVLSAIPVTSYIKDTCSNLSLSNWWRETKLFELVTGPATKPSLSGNMSPNIKACENGWSNFSEILSVVAMKLLELTKFATLNLSIYFNFIRCCGLLWCWNFKTGNPFTVNLYEVYDLSLHGVYNVHTLRLHCVYIASAQRPHYVFTASTPRQHSTSIVSTLYVCTVPTMCLHCVYTMCLPTL